MSEKKENIVPKEVPLALLRFKLQDYFKREGKEEKNAEVEANSTVNALKRTLIGYFYNLNETERKDYYRETDVDFIIGLRPGSMIRTSSTLEGFLGEIKDESSILSSEKDKKKPRISEERYRAMKSVFQKLG